MGGGAAKSMRQVLNVYLHLLGLSRKGPFAHTPPARPPAREIRRRRRGRRRRRRPAQRDPAGPAPSTAAHSALPGASPGSPASYFHRTGLLSTHFIIPFQVDPNLPRAPSPGSTPPPPPNLWLS